MIPISLFVTIEITRLTQALFMFSDNEMRSPQGERMRPNNSNLNEDLGRVRFLVFSRARAAPSGAYTPRRGLQGEPQVDHIFSDKTGTLTQNLLKVKHWYIQGRISDEDDDGTFGRLAKVTSHPWDQLFRLVVGRTRMRCGN